MERRKAREVRIGDRVIGGDHPILIQSMTNTKTEDVKATVEQIHRLEAAGCEIIRCAVPTMEAAEAFFQIKKEISIPPLRRPSTFRICFADLISSTGSPVRETRIVSPIP